MLTGGEIETMAGAIIFLAIVVFIGVIVGIRNANQNYTIGSGMFKKSDDNLEGDKHIDPADYDYYNKKGKNQ